MAAKHALRAVGLNIGIELGTALAIMALHAMGASKDDPQVSKAVQALLKKQDPFGRWNEHALTGFVTTAYTLQALARLYPVNDGKPTRADFTEQARAPFDRVGHRQLLLGPRAVAHANRKGHARMLAAIARDLHGQEPRRIKIEEILKGKGGIRGVHRYLEYVREGMRAMTTGQPRSRANANARNSSINFEQA